MYFMPQFLHFQVKIKKIFLEFCRAELDCMEPGHLPYLPPLQLTGNTLCVAIIIYEHHWRISIEIFNYHMLVEC